MTLLDIWDVPCNFHMGFLVLIRWGSPVLHFAKESLGNFLVKNFLSCNVWTVTKQILALGLNLIIDIRTHVTENDHQLMKPSINADCSLH